MDIDPVAALRSWIIDNCASLVTLIGGPGNERIYSPGLPRNQVSSMPRGALTFYQDDSISDVSLYISEILFSFHCYGEDDKGANEVFRALDNCINRQSCIIDGTVAGSRTLAFTCFRATGPTQLVEPRTEWPLTRATYRIRFWEDLT